MGWSFVTVYVWCSKAKKVDKKKLRCVLGSVKKRSSVSEANIVGEEAAGEEEGEGTLLGSFLIRQGVEGTGEGKKWTLIVSHTQRHNDEDDQEYVTADMLNQHVFQSSFTITGTGTQSTRMRREPSRVGDGVRGEDVDAASSKGRVEARSLKE